MFTSKKPDVYGNNSIYFYESYSSKDVNESLVGRKGLSLFKLRDMDIPVPHFFVISPIVYNDLVFRTFENKIEKYIKENSLPDPMDIEKIILQTKFPAQFEEELLRAYTKLSGFSDAWVAVRSSVVYTVDKNAMFTGVFRTDVNVRGYDDLVTAVKKIYASVFKDAVVVYAKKNGIDLSQLRMAVVVQKMVQAEVSGITYTKDPITQDKNKISMEAVFGLGDVIANGEITPDRYVMNKKDLSFEEKHISPQEWMRVRMLNTKGKGGSDKIKISSAWSHQQKLEDRFLKEIAKLSLIVEESTGLSQNIEWVWESGRVWIIQNKPIVDTPVLKEILSSESPTVAVLDPAMEIMKEKLDEKKQEEIVNDMEKKVVENAVKFVKPETGWTEKIQKLTEKIEKKDEKLIEKKLLEISKNKQKIFETEKSETKFDEKKLKFLMSGVGSSYGSKIGEVIAISPKNYKTLTVTKENILLIKDPFVGIENYAFLSGGIIMDGGGLTSDLSILCREIQIPAIVATGVASKILKNGDIVKIDGNSGAIYVARNEVNYSVEGVEKAKKMEVKPVVVPVKKEEVKPEVRYEVVEEVVKKEEKKIQEAPVSKSFPITATKILLAGSKDGKYDMGIVRVSNGVALVDLDQMMIAQKRHPLAFKEEGSLAEYTNDLAKKLDEIADIFAGSEVIVSLGNSRVLDFQNLVKGKTYETSENPSLRGVPRYLMQRDMMKIALKVVSKARNVYRNRNISIAFHSPLSGENMKEIKKLVSSLGLRRSSTFNIYAIIENPSEIILVEEILSAEIDGLILNVPFIACQMQGLSIFDEKATYSLENASLFKALDSISIVTKKRKSKMFAIGSANKKLIKKLIEIGCYGVIISEESFETVKKLVAEKEAELVMFGGR